MKRNMLLLAVCMVSLAAKAQPSSGTYSVQFHTTNVPVFTATGSIATNIGGDDQTFLLELTPRGRFRGTYSAHYEDYGLALDLSGRLGGQISSQPPVYHLVLTGRGSVSGSAFGQNVSGSQSFRAVLEADLGTGLAQGNVRVNVCLRGRGCQSMNEPLSFELVNLQSDEGDWTLTLNITVTKSRISGTAQATVFGGQTVDFRVLGAYSRKTGLCKLQLRGVADGAGAVLQLTSDSEMNLRSIRGKLFGQRIDATLTP